MSTYATVQDLIDRFGEREIAQITNRTGLDVIDVDAAELALADANAEVHSYIATRYPVPFDPVPQLIVRLVCDIARYRLYDDAVPEEIRNRYTDAVRILGRVASGEASFGVAEASPSHAQTAQVVSRPHSLFGRRPNGGLM
ncbi:MAG: gp436 family protein [Rhodocyclaceae bacterium]